MQKKVIAVRIIVICIWLCVWQLISTLMGLDMILAGPVKVLFALYQLLGQKLTYIIAATSFLKIAAGFLLAFVLGVVLGICAAKYRMVKELLSPLAAVMKTLPVAAFIILALVAAGSSRLSVIISVIVAFPMIYHATLAGYAGADKKMQALAEVFQIKSGTQLRYLYLPSIFQSVRTNLKTAVGMCFKAGVAAEVIGIPLHSIGEQMYLSKLYIQTDVLLAWSVLLIGMSIAFEAVFIKGLEILMKRIER